MSAARFEIKVTPRASRTQIAGWREGTLLIKVTAPPVDSAANDAVVALLSSALGVPKRGITIVRGETSRTKQVEIAGLTLEAVRTRLTA